MSKRNSLNFKLNLGTRITPGGIDNRMECDIPTLIKTRLLITANSGGGKSWLLRLIAEGLAPHMPVHIIDPEGDFATLREKFNFVLVGKGGETPADPRSIETVVHKLLELRASAVFDLYEMNPSARHEFVKLYARAMINAPKKLWGPTAVFFDEAHLWCPETGSSVAKEEVVGFATRGRKRGYLSIYATQRLSNFSKDASSPLLNRIVGGTFEDVDLKRVIELLSVESSERVAFSKEMRLLEPGLFYALGRALSRERILFKSGDVQTTHEDDQKYASAPPPPPARIKAHLPQLADLPKEAEEKAATEKELRAKIRQLETDLKTEKARVPTAPAKVTETKINVIDKLSRRAIENLRISLDAAINLQSGLSERFEKARVEAAATLAQLKTIAASTQAQPQAPQPIRHAAPIANNRPLLEQPGPIKPTGEYSPGQCARAILGVLFSQNEGATMGKIALLAGYRISGGLRNSLADLRTAGLMIGENTGTMHLTAEGIAYCMENGLSTPIPNTADDRVKYWTNHGSMGECARKIIQTLWVLRRPMTMQELAEATGYKITGGFRNSTGDLRTAGVIIGKNTELMQLNPELFT